MGGVKKVFKSIGGLIGLGGSNKVSAPAAVVTEPAPTVVTDISGDSVASERSKASEKKKRRGFASTQLTGSTIVGDSTSSGRSTLG